MLCRVCGGSFTQPLWVRHTTWHRCVGCGSDSAEMGYRPELYNAPLFREAEHELAVQGFANVVNLAKKYAIGKRLLDVGCYDGVGMEALQREQFETHGFDVNPYSRSEVVTIADRFRASLWARPFDALVSCEELEHIEEFHEHLEEFHAALVYTGVLVIQTPTPLTDVSHFRFESFYSAGHIQLFSERMLAAVVASHGFLQIEHYVTEGTQCAAFRRV
jgi:cyclopropane fatty-acyl-phospholipid synthase-like methyltransferase